jgi:hypothetical protein
MSPAWVELPELDGGVGLRIVLPYPPSDNACWTAARVGGSGRATIVETAAARIYKREVGLLLGGSRPLMGDVVVTELRVYRPMKRGDLGNRLAVLMDSLQGFAFLDDDQVCAYRNFERHDDAARPRVELELYGERRATEEEIRTWVLRRATAKAKRRAAR